MTRMADGAALSGGSGDIKSETVYVMEPGGARLIRSTPYRTPGDATLEWTCAQFDTLGRVVAVAVYTLIKPDVCVPDPEAEDPPTPSGIGRTDYDGNRIRSTDPAGRADEFLE